MLRLVSKTLFKPDEKLNYNLLVSWWFLRGLGLIYLGAFASMSTQIEGLIGVNGILPIQNYLKHISQIDSGGNYWQYPTLFWVNASDTAPKLACYFGIFAALLVTTQPLHPFRLNRLLCVVFIDQHRRAAFHLISMGCIFVGKRFSANLVNLAFPNYRIFIPLADCPFHVHGWRGKNCQRRSHLG